MEVQARKRPQQRLAWPNLTLVMQKMPKERSIPVAAPRQEHTMSFSFGDLFWIFFAFVALQPVIRQRVIDAMRARKNPASRTDAPFARHPARTQTGNHAASRLSPGALHRPSRL
jgi:hypothetical protein